MTVRKAIFPVAGLGTRFLPATKSIPKEILTLVDRPLIDYAVEEARAAGIKDFIFVTSRGKSALSDYFDDAPELEARLEAAGKWDALEAVRRATMHSGKIASVRQNKPLGLGHAVACAAQLVEAHAEVGGCVVAATRVPKSDISRYGVIAPDEFAPKARHRLTRAAGLVEKPAPEGAPSDLAVVGRYILTPSVMRQLETARPGLGGEIQLTDAIAAEIEQGGRICQSKCLLRVQSKVPSSRSCTARFQPTCSTRALKFMPSGEWRDMPSNTVARRCVWLIFSSTAELITIFCMAS